MEQQNRSMSLRFCLWPHQWIIDETKYGNHNDDDRLVQLLEATEQYNRHNCNQDGWEVHDRALYNDERCASQGTNCRLVVQA